MIFLSHSSKDKELIEPLAVRLKAVFGQENIFYDSWSIKPGDGIIEKMNEGLEKCQWFFWFISHSSLASQMVSLEWEAGLIAMTKGHAKFIPVRIDNSEIPLIILNKKYIDLYQNGFEVGLRQIVELIQGIDSATSAVKGFNNVVSTIEYNTPQECVITFEARYTMEPYSEFMIAFNSNTDDIEDHRLLTDAMYSGGFNKNTEFDNGIKLDIFTLNARRNLAPGFPVRILFKAKEGQTINVAGTLKKINENRYEPIPISIKQLA